MAIVFLADHSVSKGGFLATWSSDSSGSLTPVLIDVIIGVTEIISNILHIISPGCGGVLHSDYGIIKSPNFPQNFPASVECSWRIIAHEGNHLEMSYDSHFQIPDSSGSCLNSYVKVHSLESE